MNYSKAYKAALGGVVAALSVTLMLLCGIIPFGTYAFPCFAGIILISIAIEIGYPLAFAVYAVVSVLSVLFVADKEAALYYVMFFGFYPVLRKLIEKIPLKPVVYVIKFLLFNACVIGAFFVAMAVLSIDKDEFTLFGIYVPWVFLIIGNLVFIAYDLCIDRLERTYMIKIHPIFTKKH